MSAAAPVRGRKGRDLQAPTPRARSAGAQSRVNTKVADRARAASVGPSVAGAGAAAAAAASALPAWNTLTPQSKLELYTALFQGTDGEHDFHSEGQAFAIYKATDISIPLTKTDGSSQAYTCSMEQLLAHYLSGIRGATRKEGRFKLFAAQYFPTLGHSVNILSAFGALEITYSAGSFKVQGTTAAYPTYAALPPGEYTATKDVARRILQEIAPSAGQAGNFIMCDGCPDPPGSFGDANLINVLHTMATAADSSTGFSGYPTAQHLIGLGKPAFDEFTMTPNILMSLTKPNIRFKLVGKPGAGNFDFVVMENGEQLCRATFPLGKSSGPSITYLANLASDDALLTLACDSTVSEPKFAAEYKKRTGNNLADSMWNFRGILKCLRNLPSRWSLDEIKQMLFTEKGNGDSRPKLEREALYQDPCKALVSIDELSSLNGASCNNGDNGKIEPLDYTSMYTHGENSVEIYKLPPRDINAQRRLVYNSCVFAVSEHNNLVDRINKSKTFCANWNAVVKPALQIKKIEYDGVAEGGAAAAGGAGGAVAAEAAAAAEGAVAAEAAAAAEGAVAAEAAAAAKNAALLRATITKLGANIFSECIENKVNFYDILCPQLGGIEVFQTINVGNIIEGNDYTPLKSQIDAQTKIMQGHRNIIDAIDGKNPVDEVTRLQGVWNRALELAQGNLRTFEFPLPQEERNRNIIIDKRDKRKNFFNELFNALQDVVNRIKDTKTTKLMKLHVAALKNIITCKIDDPNIFGHLLAHFDGAGQGGGGKKQVGGTREEDIMRQIKEAEAEIDLITEEENPLLTAEQIDALSDDEYNRIYNIKQYIQCCWSYLDYLYCVQDYDRDNSDAAAAAIAAAIPTILGQLRELTGILHRMPAAAAAAGDASEGGEGLRAAAGAGEEAVGWNAWSNNGRSNAGSEEEASGNGWSAAGSEEEAGGNGWSAAGSEEEAGGGGISSSTPATLTYNRGGAPYSQYAHNFANGLGAGVISEGEDESNAEDSESNAEAGGAGGGAGAGAGAGARVYNIKVQDPPNTSAGAKGQKRKYALALNGPALNEPALNEPAPKGRAQKKTRSGEAEVGALEMDGGARRTRKNRTRKQTRKHKSKTRKNRPRFTNRTRRNKHSQ